MLLGAGFEVSKRLLQFQVSSLRFLFMDGDVCGFLAAASTLPSWTLTLLNCKP